MGLVGKSGLAAFAAFGLLRSAAATDITGAGSTFAFPILSKWSADYRQATGATVAYYPIGSGAVIAQIKSAIVDFSTSDAPLKPEELKKLGLRQFPLVVGGIVPVIL